MLAELQRRFDRLETQRHAFLRKLTSFSMPEGALRPSEHAWSMHDVVEHLALVEQGTLRALRSEKHAAQAGSQSRGDLRYLLLRLMLKLDVRLKVPVKGVLPTGQCTLGELEQRWGETRRELGSYLESVNAERLQRPVFRHPVAGWLTIGQTLGFIEGHVEHHQRQVARIQQAVRRTGGKADRRDSRTAGEADSR